MVKLVTKRPTVAVHIRAVRMPRRRGGLGDIGPGPGQCPMQPDGSCLLDGRSISCSLVRECDAYDSATHFEYAQPGGSPNADIDIFGQQLTAQGSVYGPAPAPTPQALTLYSLYQAGAAINPQATSPATNTAVNQLTATAKVYDQVASQMIAAGNPGGAATIQAQADAARSQAQQLASQAATPATNYAPSPATYSPLTQAYTAPAAQPGATSSSSSAPAKTYSPKFNWMTSGDRQKLKSGDSWTIVITGAAPNASVRNSTTWTDAAGVTHNGDSEVAKTDASGNLSLAGTVTDAEIGAWREVWTVAGQSVAEISFTVSAVAVSSGATTDSSSSSAAAVGGGGSATGETSTPQTSLGAEIMAALPAWAQDAVLKAESIAPWYVWAGALAAGAYYATSGHRKRGR